jgi:hypothetical protein
MARQRPRLPPSARPFLVAQLRHPGAGRSPLVPALQGLTVNIELASGSRHVTAIGRQGGGGVSLLPVRLLCLLRSSESETAERPKLGTSAQADAALPGRGQLLAGPASARASLSGTPSRPRSRSAEQSRQGVGIDRLEEKTVEAGLSVGAGRPPVPPPGASGRPPVFDEKASPFQPLPCVH